MTKPVNPKPSSRTFATATITTAADGLSEAVSLTGLSLCSLQMSTAWSAASLGLQASVDGSTNYVTVYGSTGDVLSFATSASRMLILDPWVTSGLQSIRLVSQTTNGSSATAQAAARTIKLGLAEL